MTPDTGHMTNRHRLALLGTAALYVALSTVGITWGLPSREIDPYLFGDAEPWSGEKIYRLAHAAEKLSPEAIRSRGADVDVDPARESRGPHRGDDSARGARPTGKSVPQAKSVPREESRPIEASSDDKLAVSDEPILLTATDEDVAKIYLRYRLYTYQPDEMITMMALAGMRPGAFKFDPRLYQYGGLWVYPVGALIKLCGIVGLIDVRGDLVFYLDNPDEFGKFYVVARAYSAAWGVLGVFVVFAITRRLFGVVGSILRPTPGEDNKPSSDREGADGLQSTVNGGQSTVRATRAASSSARGPSNGAGVQERSMSARPEGRGSRATRAALLAALFFALMPVVVCMAHEGKPHLPGAVLMLTAVYFAMRTGQRAATFSSRGEPECEEPRGHAHGDGSRGVGQSADSMPPAVPGMRDWWLMCVCCGAALGMVLSSWPIFVLIPVVAWLRSARVMRRASGPAAHPEHGASGTRPTRSRAEDRYANEPQPSGRADQPNSREHKEPVNPRGLKPAARWIKKTAIGVAVAIAVYLITNPYIVINAVINRDVLASNFGNSFAMYEIARVGAGFLRVLELTVEGATLPIVVIGAITLVVGLIRRKRKMIPLVAAAAVFFLQFVLIGAGKPAEYGRFGIFPNAALAIGAAILLTTRWTRLRGIVNVAPASLTLIWISVYAALYLANFATDCGSRRSRTLARDALAEPLHFLTEAGMAETIRKNLPSGVAVLNDAAPYNCPPLDFSQTRVLLFASADAARTAANRDPRIAFVRPTDVSSRRLGPETSHLFPPRFSAVLLRWFADQPTPISWANKTFEIVRGSRTEVVPR